MQLIQLTGEADALFWAQASVFISIAKQSFIIFTAACVFRYFVKRTVPAFAGAVLYGVSIIYFRHEVYWDFSLTVWCGCRCSCSARKKSSGKKAGVVYLRLCADIDQQLLFCVY
ncbi:YfhO family protein [Bacillus velezensis]|uniref:YfhO family protein n=1 Tax=Bacillus velezensis TaxID=492670 RepID=UPI001F0F328C|nr:YfhO family protein [Bacillus velezensis]